MSSDESESFDPNSPFHQEVRHQSISARIPDGVKPGVFATTSIIVDARDMFLIDFVNGAAPPPQLAARVVLSAGTMSQLTSALRHALDQLPSKSNAASSDSDPAPAEPGRPVELPGGTVDVSAGIAADPANPTPPTETPAENPPNVEDLYEEMQFNDEDLAGAFANTAIIRQTVDETVFDFVANLYPRAVVTARVIMPTSRVERLHVSLQEALNKWRRERGE